MTHNIGNTNAHKHGFSRHPLYTVWQGMRRRCFDPNHAGFKSWGGRGISICDRWLEFVNFRDDMAASYKPGLSLDRIDNNGDYEPNNCRWATRSEQCRNKQNSPPTELLARLEAIGLNWSSYRKRLQKGWTEYEAQTIPKGVKR